MKRSIFLFVAILVSIGAYAQTDTSHKRMSPPDFNNQINKPIKDTIRTSSKASPPGKISNPPNTQPVMKDGLMMNKGKMMIVKNGKMTMMDEDITLSNGIKVMTNGTVIKKDGSKTMLYEGQHIDMTGKMIPMKN